MNLYRKTVRFVCAPIHWAKAITLCIPLAVYLIRNPHLLDDIHDHREKGEDIILWMYEHRDYMYRKNSFCYNEVTRKYNEIMEMRKVKKALGGIVTDVLGKLEQLDFNNKESVKDVLDTIKDSTEVLKEIEKRKK